jgi:hypothetical protein
MGLVGVRLMEYALVYAICSITASPLRIVLKYWYQNPVIHPWRTSREHFFSFGRELLMADAGRSAGGLNRANPS